MKFMVQNMLLGKISCSNDFTTVNQTIFLWMVLQ
jgi:hypothetical protein